MGPAAAPPRGSAANGCCSRCSRSPCGGAVAARLRDVPESKTTLTPLYVGIDLGTTNSAAAVFDGERVNVVRNAQGATVTPSVVRLDKQARVTVGTRARRFVEQDPANTAAEFKRLMGTGKAIEFPAAN